MHKNIDQWLNSFSIIELNIILFMLNNNLCHLYANKRMTLTA